jgi:crotonobetainyl-CoA:carnitine CoA-transferase CaiB-like acyl-CoA transferase
MPMPLEGLRVLDWTIWQQGPVCSAMLGDLGAEVIKLEARDGGDPGRGLVSIGGAQARPNFYFEANNRNKKSLTLDLKQPEARKIVYELAAVSDVFVQNFRKGVAARLGLDYASLRERNPRIIYANATGYGPEGPDSGEPSFDQLGLARSGLMLAAGEPGMPPLPIAGGIADQMGAVVMAYGVLAALVARERYGIGQEVDASHLGSMSFLQGLSLSCKLMAGFAFPRTFRARAPNALWNHYRCADDKWLALGMLQSDRYWKDLCRALGRPELGDDPRFVDFRKRTENAGDCVGFLDETFATKPRADWMKILHDGGDFIFTVVNSVDDLPGDPQMRINGYIVDVEHPQFGPTPMVGVPVRLSETPGSVREPAPELGQHTELLLTELLGYDWDRIGALRDKGVI